MGALIQKAIEAHGVAIVAHRTAKRNAALSEIAARDSLAAMEATDAACEENHSVAELRIPDLSLAALCTAERAAATPTDEHQDAAIEVHITALLRLQRANRQ